MIIYDIIKWLNIFIVLNPFLSMALSITIGFMFGKLQKRIYPVSNKEKK